MIFLCLDKPCGNHVVNLLAGHLVGLASGAIVAVVDGPATKINGFINLLRDMDKKDALTIIFGGGVFQLDRNMQIAPGNIAQAVNNILSLLTCRREQGCVVIDAEGKSAAAMLSLRQFFEKCKK